MVTKNLDRMRLKVDKVECKKCKSENYIKSGIIRGHQRYKCKDCNCQFTATPTRGVKQELKDIAILLYGYCGLSMLKISKLLGVSMVAVLKWVRAAGEKIEEPNPKSDSGIVIIDEMWHFVDQKNKIWIWRAIIEAALHKGQAVVKALNTKNVLR